MAVANVPINILNAHSSHAIWGFQSMFFLKVFLAKKCCHTTLKQQVPYYIIYYKGSRYLLTEWSVCYRDWNCLRSVAAPRPFWTGQKFAQFWHLSNTKCKDCSTFRAKSCKDKGFAAILLHTKLEPSFSQHQAFLVDPDIQWCSTEAEWRIASDLKGLSVA
jgi:hypothetical protein